MRVGLVINQFEIRVIKIGNVLDFGIDFHFGEGVRLAGQLQLGLFKVVQIYMRVTKCMHKFTNLISTYLGDHHG